MFKKTNRYWSLILVFCMMLNMVSALPVIGAEEGKETQAPLITVEGIEDGKVVNKKEFKFNITVTGDVYDNALGYISENIKPKVTVNEIDTIVLYEDDNKYKVTAQLDDGDNSIRIEATNEEGQSAEAKVFNIIYEKPKKSEEEKIQEALDKLYVEFSGHNSRNPIPFPYGEGEGQYTNAITYINARLKELVPNYDVEFGYGSSFPGTIASGTIIEQKTMDEFGNITPVYCENFSKPFFTAVKFKIGDFNTEKGFQLHLAVDPIPVTNQEMVDKEVSGIIFDVIKGKNASKDYITSSIGEMDSRGNIKALKGTPELYPSNIGIVWGIKNIEGKENALSLGSDNKTFVSRPNVDEGDAKFILTGTVSHQNDNSAKTEVSFDLTVPAFKGYKVPIRISPSDAILEITDSYYKEIVDDKYIKVSEGGSLREVTLHGSATDNSQSYNYVISKEGYITRKNSYTERISVDNKDLEEIQISLEPSTSNDSKLELLEITNPEVGAASIITPMEEFRTEKKNYTMEVGDIPSITIKPTVLVEGATIDVNAATSKTNSNLKNYSINSGSTRLCYLFEGKNTITITVNVPDSSTQEKREESYTLTVMKDTSTFYPLEGMGIEAYDSFKKGKNNSARPEEELLFPRVDSGGITDEYTYYVNTYRENVRVTPKVKNEGKVEDIKVNEEYIKKDGEYIKIEEQKDEIGRTSEKINLIYGNNSIKVEVKVKDVEEPFVYNINIRRKQPTILNSYSADGNGGKFTGAWTGQVNFSHSSIEAEMIFDIPEDANVSIDGIEGSYKNGEIVKVPVGNESSKMLTIRVSEEFTEDGKSYIDSHAYIIGLYRLASSSPDAVESYLPAPGQFVNQSSYDDPTITLRPNPSMVTLGAFGGSIVYRFDEPIKNDPTNPYGIDFIVYGNVFRNNDGSSASGAAEPAAVMVSNDGKEWYELAGSLYYDADTRHNIEVTYTNPDTTFSKAKDVAWEDNEGNKGDIGANKSHSQPYYPNPANYSRYNLPSSIGYNSSYTENSVKFNGTILKGLNAPAFGYADAHAHADDFSQKAVNPYVEKHNAITNGDGMDISWAVDSNGKPVKINEVKYVKVYNPNLHMGGSTGEISPEIAFAQRVEGESKAVGMTDDLKTLSVNGKKVDIEAGKYEYHVNIEGASSFNVNASLSEEANIWVNDNWFKSGTNSPYILAGKTIRIIAQEGIKEPVIYLVHLENAAQEYDNADLKNIILLPGDINATRDGNVFSALVDSTTSSVIVQASPLSESSSVYIDTEEVYKNSNWQSNKYIQIAPGETESVPIRVVSKNGVEEIFTLNITRRELKEEDEDKNEIKVSFKLIGTSTWISKEYHTVPVNSSVKYLTDKVLASHGIPFVTNSAGTYIESIKGLGEFDKGPNSGWMYTVNGTHRNVDGYAIQILNQGDEIEWHYTTDYTKEEGSEDFSDNKVIDGPTEDKKNKENTIELNLTGKPDKDGVYKAKLQQADLKKIVENISKITNKKGETCEIDIKTADKSQGFSLTLNSIVFEGLKGKDKVSFAIKSDIGTMKLDSGTIKEINKQTGNVSKDIEFIFRKAKEPILLKEKNIEIYGEHLYEAKILIGKNKISDFNGGNVELFFPLKPLQDMNPKMLSVEHIKPTGEIDKLKDVVYDMGKLYGEPGLVVNTDSFSFFAVTYNDAESFTDLLSTHWAYNDIMDMVNNNLVKGTGNDKFEPNRGITRAEFTQVLANISPEKIVEEKSIFFDVNTDDWHFKSVNWAYNNKIILGTSDEKFMPNSTISRQDAVVMINRYLDYKGHKLISEKDIIEFNDFDEIADYAKESVKLLAKEGLINGKDDDKFDPNAFMTRAEAASIVLRIIKSLDL